MKNILHRRFLNLFFICISLFCSLDKGICLGQSLEDVLGNEGSDFKQSRPETIKLWDDLITALEQSDFVKAKDLSTQFNNVIDFTEPFQKTYTTIVLTLLDDVKKQALVEADSKRSGFSKVFSSSDLGKIRKDVVAMIEDLSATKNFRAAAAIANAYLKKVEPDEKINKMAQEAVDTQKLRNKAITIAKAALSNVKQNMDAKQLWTAQAELAKAIETIRQRVTEKRLLEFVDLEMNKSKNELELAIQSATKKRDSIMEITARNGSEGARQFGAFHAEYPDYPEYEADKIKIDDLRGEQINAKYIKTLSAIEAVILNDPKEARMMIKNLLEKSDASPEDISLMRSKITALQRSIVEQEAAAIRNRMDEAQSYLTKFDTTYAQELKMGILPKLSLTKSVFTSTENLVRARSVQAGAVKELEQLLQEEMDNVTKAKLVGLLATQKAAVEQMDHTLKQKNVIITIAILFIVLLAIAISVVIFRIKHKNPPPIMPTC